MGGWSRTSDDVLLAGLTDALCPSPLEPSDQAIDVLVDAVARSVSGRVTRHARAGRHRPRVRLAGAALAGGLAAAVSAVAAGASLPDQLRALAVDVGLPIAPPAVAHLRSAMAVLTADLQPGSGAGPARTAVDAQAVIDDWQALDTSWHATERTAVQQLLADACQAIAGRVPSTALPTACSDAAGAAPSVGTRTPSGATVPATASEGGTVSENPEAAAPGTTGNDANTTNEAAALAAGPASAPAVGTTDPSVDSGDPTSSTGTTSTSSGSDGTSTAPTATTATATPDDTSLVTNDILLDGTPDSTTTTTTTTTTSAGAAAPSPE